MNIFEKRAAITAEVGTVAKNLNVSAGKNNSYKAVGERDVIDAVKPLEKKFGVYSYPVNRETLESERLESESEYQGKVTKKTTFYTRIKTVYRFVNVEKPEEYLETVTFSVGIDSQDKGDGKAMTYGDKYALMKAYKISTGDDPDQEASEDTNYRREKRDVCCEMCGNPLRSYIGNNGDPVPVERHVAGSMKKFGKVLCIDCIKKNES